MKLESFWTDTASCFQGRTDALPGRVDVAVVGGGFTGLSAARALARRGARVAVLEAGKVAAEASGRAGEKDGLFYSMGYSGHGTQMSVPMGERMARVMAGEAAANPWRDNPWPAIPGHFGPPWFLPAISAYYRLKDKLG